MSAVLTQQLTYLLQQRRRLYRPLQWRTIVPVKTGIPNWAETVSVFKVTENSNEPVPHQIGNQKAPIPSIDRTGGSLKLAEYALAYQIWDADIERKIATGIDVQTSSVAANSRACEEFLDKVASTGHTQYALPGLLSSADVATVTVVGGWAAKAALGTAAGFASIAKDVADTLFAVFDNSKNLLKATQLLLPDTSYQILTQNFHPTSGKSYLELIQSANPGVRFVPWFKLRTAGAGSATRMVAGDFSEDVLSMIMVHELQDGAPLRVHGGFEVLQTVKVGGVIIEQPQGLAYADGI